ncbi:MAG TPA: hypothetical protein PKA06_07965 [Gemmatales bacterium]|nr:hypothetical protein [Gemmatales bacterium]HMP17539.1 hypothetical protein [Gemmatales bacterium]
MRFQVTIYPDAAYILSKKLQFKLARRAARKVMRMGDTSATVIFPGPKGLHVTVDCRQASIVIAQKDEVERAAYQRLRRPA